MKVSILCTAYNHEKYIGQALDSFLAQKTDFPFEVLVTDDASTDMTPSILAEYAVRYPDVVRFFHQDENLFSRGTNLIYDSVMYPNARGQYIALCEGDDYWCDPDKLQKQIDFLDANPEYSACVHNSYLHYCEDDRDDEILIPSTGDHDVPFSQIIKGLHTAFHTSSIVARREYMENSPDYTRVAANYGFLDYPWAINLSLNGKIRFIDKPMSVYRINSNDGSWRSGFDKNYAKKITFVKGEIAMMTALLPHLDGDNAELTKSELIMRKYELNYLEGNVKALIKEPYVRLFRNEPFSFKAKTIIKLLFPKFYVNYRKERGYSIENSNAAKAAEVNNER